MGFKTTEFSKENFNVGTWWIIGAVLGGLPPIACFLASAVLRDI